MQRTREDLEAAAWAAGARLLDAQLVRRRDGSLTLAGHFAFSDPWAAARLLDVLAAQDADDPAVQAWARAILEETARTYRTSPRDPRILDAFAEAIHTSVQEAIRFEPEEGERFQSADTTMIEGVGDCDCHARLVHAVALAGGIGSAIRYFDNGKEPVHAVAALETSRGPKWAETTIGARFGEHPQAAYRRLGLDRQNARPDIGFLGLEFVTPGDVERRKAELDAYVSATDASVVACGHKIDEGTGAAWDDFVSSWRAFMADKAGWLDSGAQGRQAAEFATTIRAWQEKLAPICGSSAPVVPEAPADQTVTVVKAIALTAGIVVVGGLAYKVADALLPRRRAA